MVGLLVGKQERDLAGKAVGALVGQFDKHARSCEAAGEPLSAELIALRDDIKKAMDRRNALVC